MRPRAPGGGAVAACSVALLAGALAGCARPGAPRGGPEDRRPPVVIEASPAPLSRVDDPNEPIRFRFSERISERPQRGVLDEAVLVSPMTGAVQVDHDGDQIRVFVEGGLRPGMVYRITVLPVLVDLFNNRMSEPFELVVSTGGDLIESAVAGQALDRITGRPVADYLVALLPTTPQPDTVLHLARTDPQGLFFFRYVPLGRYSQVAFEDRNRNLTPDPNETQGARGVAVVGPDTLITDLTVLAPDTTEARLVRGETVDSAVIRLVFDDYLDPAVPEGTGVDLAEVEDDTIAGPVPAVTRVLHPAAWDALRDSLARGPDSAAAGGDLRPSRVPRPELTLRPPGQERGGLVEGAPLPRQELIVLLDGPLTPGKRYRVSAARVTNVNGLSRGGGEDTVTWTPPPPDPDDAMGAPADSVAEPGDAQDEPAGDPIEPADRPDEPAPPADPPADPLGMRADPVRFGLRARPRRRRAGRR